MNEPIEFIAYLAGTNSSTKPITLSNEGDGRLVLEFSSSELASIMRLALVGKRLLRVSVVAE